MKESGEDRRGKKGRKRKEKMREVKGWKVRRLKEGNGWEL